jgi:hypothetical protein
MPEITSQKSKIENYKVWWDKETQTVRHWSKGKNNEQVGKESAALMQKELEKHADAAGVLVDVSETSTVSGSARAAYAAFIKSTNKRVAFFGANRIMRVVIKLVFGSAGKLENMRIFATKEEALAWLKAN